MIQIDPREYPDIPWRWRVFHEGHFLGYLDAVIRDVIAGTSKMRYSIDLEYRALELE